MNQRLENRRRAALTDRAIRALRALARELDSSERYAIYRANVDGYADSLADFERVLERELG